jgi:hypothetical protein
MKGNAKMKYVSTKDIAARWNINERSVRRYCERGQIDGASQVDGAWIIPDDTPKPKHLDREPPIYEGPARQVVAQRAKNNHYGIYEYLLVNLAYSSSRMASNRLTRKQVIELYRTGKVSIGFEPLKDILEFHVRFERIHPFEDGNGRLGRLIMLKECLRHQIVPFIIDDKHRGEYHRGIAQWDAVPEVLTDLATRAQSHFEGKMDLCRLFQYHRPIHPK